MQISKTMHLWASDAKPAGLPYAATALAIGLVTLCQYLYLPAFAGYPFQFYFPVVAIAALLFGTGVFAAVLSGLAALFFFIPPYFSLAITSSGPVVALATFGVASLMIVLVITLLSRIANHYYRALKKTECEKGEATAIMLEMHRCVAGSFHDIAAALICQAGSPFADAGKGTLQTTAQRFSAMGRIHDRLALPRDPAALIDARNFFERHCDDLQAALADENPVQFQTMIESCNIPQHQAIAAGHLLGELVEDIRRRAAAMGAATGSITVDFSRDRGFCIMMLIEHRALPAGAATLRPKRPIIGTLLNQLQGSLDIEDTTSPTYVIRFPQRRASAEAA